MARSLAEAIAKAAGYCCIYNMLEHNESVSPGVLGRHLGLDTPVILYHRKRKSQGLLLPCYDCIGTYPISRDSLRLLPELRRSARRGRT